MNSPEDSVVSLFRLRPVPILRQLRVVAKDLDSWEGASVEDAFVRSSIPTALPRPISHPPDSSLEGGATARYLPEDNTDANS